MNQQATPEQIPSAAAFGRRDVVPAAVAAFLIVAMWLAGWMDPLDRIVGDTALRWTHLNPTDVPVAVVAIDDASVAAIGPLPWPRPIIARLVTATREAGAGAVAVDLLLIDSSDTLGDTELETSLEAGPSVLAAALDPVGRWLLPHPQFGGVDRAAHVHAEIGADGVARTIAATKQAEGLSLPAFSLSIARLIDPEIAIRPGVSLRPDFRPAPDRITRIPAVELLAAPEAAACLAGRAVLIGVTATGAGDRLIVPTGPGTAPSPGVLVHASAAASILRSGLVQRQSLWWALLCMVAAALAPQLIRSRTGSLRPWSLVAMTVVIGAVVIAAMEWRHVLVSAPALVVTMMLSAALREGFESKQAQRESGLLLQSLIRHHRPASRVGVPRSAGARLTALRQLQAVVLERDAARRTLLDGMRDGVLMWDRHGATRVINPAAIELWGGEPGRSDIDTLRLDAESTAVVDRHGREVEISVFPVGNDRMALLRDVTAEREIERRRRDMQRLVSHELKTPLSSIAGFGETLERYELDPEEQRRVAALIRRESVRLGEMVATFLDLERLGSDSSALAREAVDLGELVGQRLAVLAETARARGQTIASELETGVVVRASVELVSRVADNLIGNALKYSEEGSTVTVGVHRRGGDATMVVTDRGPGIPDDARRRIFERFYRVPGVEGAGSGLGLAVVDEVVAWHGGCIELDSTVGRGSTFTVRLPAEE
ncbi:MAG: CHASE2 domain-containing protein [Thermoanaerobaculales bacterium]|jgi:signal transduction histidine kinase|nr:CHASE2 domain-containing protein [Thermoanaerobaculales bacterium]